MTAIASTSFQLLVASIFLVLGAGPPQARAQQPPFVGTELQEYVRLLELSGRLRGAPLVFQPLSARHVGRSLRSDSAHPWAARYPLRLEGPAASRPRVNLLDPMAHTVFQSAYPRSVNDGALWAGKGASAELKAGALATWGPVTATLYPTAYTTANADFAIVPINNPARTAYSYPWSEDIDWPQRFGNAAVTELDWGHSGIRLDLAGFTAGLSTENMWWGPASVYPILMSNNAPGFPHVDLGTGRPVATIIGRVETRFVWGRLSESDYFDFDSTNNRRLFVGFTAAWEPRWTPGLTLGLGRLFYMPWDSVEMEDHFIVFQNLFKDAFRRPDNPGGDDDRDQMLSLFTRWAHPESNFEIHLEWARNDHSGNLRDFLLEPEHGQAFVLGFNQALGSASRLWRIRGEITHLERSRTFAVRASPVFYSHRIVKQGYTHRGQIIGAAIGRSASSQYFGIDRYDAGGRWGFFATRVRYDTDDYYTRFGPTRTHEGHDVELTAGLSALRFLGDFDIGAAVEVSRELNRYATVGNDVTNLRAELTVSWHIQ